MNASQLLLLLSSSLILIFFILNQKNIKYAFGVCEISPFVLTNLATYLFLFVYNKKLFLVVINFTIYLISSDFAIMPQSPINS